MKTVDYLSLNLAPHLTMTLCLQTVIGASHSFTRHNPVFSHCPPARNCTNQNKSKKEATMRKIVH